MWVGNKIEASGSAGTSAVAAGKKRIEIRVPDRGGADGQLLELTPEGLYRAEAGAAVWRGPLDGRTIELDRYEAARDRVFSAFLTLDEAGDPLGALAWATEFSSVGAREFSFPRPATKKGLNCLVMVDDAIELGVGHVVENISIGGIVDLDTPDPEFYQVVDGHRIGFNGDAVRDMDERFRRFREAGIDVTGILLNPKPASAHYGEGEAHSTHPVLFPSRAALDGRNVNIVAFNFETPEGMHVYRAVVEFLADRYTRPDGRYGWMSGLVIGNEIQAHWVWHNLGDADAETVLDEYLLALRLADIAGRSRHPQFRIFASMTHHWTARGAGDPKRGLSGVEMVEFLNEKGKAGGDFPWGVAFHPYPENLFRPDFWNDRTAWLAFDAPRITMKNIEVLEAFLAREEMRQDGEIREVILSEQGFHAPVGEEGERLQAAALAWTFEKIQHLPSVRAFHLHRHVDHPREGGLLLGLWTHAGKAETPGRKKAAWEVFRAFGTEDWPKVSPPLLEVAGLSDWSEAAPAPLESIPAEREVEMPEGVAVDLFRLADTADVKGAADFRSDAFLKSAGWLADSIFHHPPFEGSSRASFRIDVPAREGELRPYFSFGTALGAPSVTGVIFRVYVNGERVFQHHHTEEVYTPHEVELAQWAGEEIDLVLEVDSNGSNAHDWAHWVEPQIIRRGE